MEISSDAIISIIVNIIIFLAVLHKIDKRLSALELIFGMSCPSCNLKQNKVDNQGKPL